MRESTPGVKYQNELIQVQSINRKGSIILHGGAAHFQTLYI